MLVFCLQKFKKWIKKIGAGILATAPPAAALIIPSLPPEATR
jgi:hypothetical protein